MRGTRARVAAVVASVLLASVLAAPPPALLAADPDEIQPAATARVDRATVYGVPGLFFPATSHNVQGDFLTFWLEHQGLRRFGLPLSEEFEAGGRIIQYFERARFERPRTGGSISLGRLGAILAVAEPPAPFQPASPVAETESSTYFPATGHTLSFAFKRYWESHGGLATFGYPLSEEYEGHGFPDGSSLTVQYFERARFEYHAEFADTPEEVQLGRVGAEVMAREGIVAAAIPKADGFADWSPTLFATTPGGPEITGARQFQAVVQSPSVQLRAAPSLKAATMSTAYRRHILNVRELIPGDLVEGSDGWYRLANDAYVSSAYVELFTPAAPPRTFAGTWIDVNLSTFYATAYDGETPLYSAIVTAGRGGKTPAGVFSIFKRVPNELMDSRTVGIPLSDPWGYYLPNVRYTQYFASGGFALHGNYWTAPWAFGSFTSNGCVGLMNPDAEWFWNWAGIGTVVHVHY